MEKLKIAWISNILFEPYLRSCIVDVFASSSIDPHITYISLEEYSERVVEISDFA